jgi:hypothetical protein
MLRVATYCAIATLLASIFAACGSSRESPRTSWSARAPTSEVQGTQERHRAPVHRLRWRKPRLRRPIVVAVTEASSRLQLDPARDYVVKLPARPLRAKGGLWLIGGHSVVVLGGEIDVPATGGGPDQAYGLFAKNQTGVLHLEGLDIHGPGLADGIVLDQGAGATVQIENARVVVRRPLQAQPAIHPDVVQTWRGPFALRIDRLTGYTTSKGFNFQPQEYEPQRLGVWHLSHINLVGGTYTLWKNDWSLAIGKRAGYWQERTSDVWVDPARPRQWAYPDRSHWAKVRLGRPPGGDFVPESVAGTRYRSANYAADPVHR